MGIVTNMVTNTTTGYRGTASRGYGDPVGIRLIAALEGTGADPFTVAQAFGEGTRLGLTSRHIITLLHRLSTAGWITRIKKGLYAINDPVTRIPRAHPFAIGTALATPSAVSHWSALQHWGLTEQAPAAITISSPTRTYPPADRNQKTQETTDRAAWTVAGIRYEAIAITEARFFGVTRVWINERNQVPIFDRERALLDTFLHFHIFGSLSAAMEILDKHLAAINVNRLIEYTLQLRVAAVIKRVGWTLDHFRTSPDILESLRTYPARGESPLDPGRPAHGHHNLKWHVIENLHDSG